MQFEWKEDFNNNYTNAILNEYLLADICLFDRYFSDGFFTYQLNDKPLRYDDFFIFAQNNEHIVYRKLELHKNPFAK